MEMKVYKKEEVDEIFSSYPNDLKQIDMIEAIPKADYENRLKADMVVILDKLRAEIESYKLSEDELSDMDEDSVKWGMKIACDIVDKCRAENEE